MNICWPERQTSSLNGEEIDTSDVFQKLTSWPKSSSSNSSEQEASRYSRNEAWRRRRRAEGLEVRAKSANRERGSADLRVTPPRVLRRRSAEEEQQQPGGQSAAAGRKRGSLKEPPRSSLTHEDSGGFTSQQRAAPLWPARRAPL